MGNNEYLIYCRKRNVDDKFGAMDLQGGQYGVKMIYASMFDDLENAKKCAESLARQNREFEFQVRKYGQSRAIYTPIIQQQELFILLINQKNFTDLY